MSDQNLDFTAEQAAAANGALRASLGLPPERFGIEQFIGMISDEIQQLRAAGKSDASIAGILSESVGVEIGSDAITRLR